MRISVISHPNSKKARIEKDLLGFYHVHVCEPPLQGKANRAIIASLAKYLNVKQNQIAFVKGATQKNKVFEIFEERSLLTNSESLTLYKQ